MNKIKLDLRFRNTVTGDFMNAAEEETWLRNLLAPHARSANQSLTVAVNLDGTEVGGGLGRAQTLALASVALEGTILDWRVESVGWDVLHDQGPHGSHHGRIVTFMQENQVSVVVAGHAGPPMVNTLLKLGILPLLGIDGDAKAAALLGAKKYRELLVGFS